MRALGAETQNDAQELCRAGCASDFGRWCCRLFATARHVVLQASFLGFPRRTMIGRTLARAGKKSKLVMAAGRDRRRTNRLGRLRPVFGAWNRLTPGVRPSYSLHIVGVPVPQCGNEEFMLQGPADVFVQPWRAFHRRRAAKSATGFGLPSAAKWDRKVRVGGRRRRAWVAYEEVGRSDHRTINRAQCCGGR